MQLKLCAYSIFVTQGTPSSNCSRCKRCPFGKVLCLALDSFESLGYSLHKKSKQTTRRLYPQVKRRVN